MTYGHAERNLATVRQLEAETRHLLLTLDRSDDAMSGRPFEFTNRTPERAQPFRSAAPTLPGTNRGQPDDGQDRCCDGADLRRAPAVPLRRRTTAGSTNDQGKTAFGARRDVLTPDSR